MNALQLIMNSLIEIVISGVFAVTARIIIPVIAEYIRERTKSEEIRFAMEELEKTAVKVVDEVEQTLVRQYKADGRWDLNSQKAVLEDAAEIMLQRLSSKTYEVMEAHGVDIDNLVVSYIEARINEKKGQTKEGI
ncbi:MAG: hypothetical protein K2M60_01060 [Lachnospiraceae bacterium]|nr:hypothetical protein [Lachnospiraceae bacterium]